MCCQGTGDVLRGLLLATGGGCNANGKFLRYYNTIINNYISTEAPIVLEVFFKSNFEHILPLVEAPVFVFVLCSRSQFV